MSEDSYEFLDRWRGAIFYQWMCDLHENCRNNPDDKYFCPSGCTYAMVNEHSKLKYPVVDPNDAAGEKACDCHDGDDCPHVIPRSDFPKLKEGMMLYAMWPFDECHYYKARVCRLQYTETFPNRDITDKITIELDSKSQNRKRKKNQKTPQKGPKPSTGGPKSNQRYYDFNPKSLECKINRNSTDTKRTIEVLKKHGRENDIAYRGELCRMNEEYKTLLELIEKNNANQS